MANNILSALRTAVFSKATSSNAFNTAIAGKIYFNEAPQDTAFPYAVFSFLPMQTNRDTGKKFYQTIVQFNIYSTTQSSVESLAEKLMDLLEDSTLTITGFTFIRIDKQPIYNMGKNDNIYGIVVPYIIEFQN